MDNGKNSLKLSWREVIDGSNILQIDTTNQFDTHWNYIRVLVMAVGYKYIAFRGIVYDLSKTEICTVYDLVPR
jgi:hypothetical protein